MEAALPKFVAAPTADPTSMVWQAVKARAAEARTHFIPKLFNLFSLWFAVFTVSNGI
jgi:hypothetical protein